MTTTTTTTTCEEKEQWILKSTALLLTPSRVIINTISQMRKLLQCMMMQVLPFHNLGRSSNSSPCHNHKSSKKQQTHSKQEAPEVYSSQKPLYFFFFSLNPSLLQTSCSPPNTNKQTKKLQLLLRKNFIRLKNPNHTQIANTSTKTATSSATATRANYKSFRIIEKITEAK